MAVQCWGPRLKKTGAMSPVRTREAMRGFGRVAPGLQRALLPRLVWHMLVGSAISRGYLDFGLTLLVQFCGHLLPTELLNLKRQQLTLATLGSGVKYIMWLLHMQGDGATSKTEERDQSILLDRPVFSMTPTIFVTPKRSR